MAIALTPFEGLCGFRVRSEILEFLDKVPELLEIVGTEAASNFRLNDNKDALKALFSSLMKTDESQITKYVQLLLNRIRESKFHDPKLGDLLVRLDSQFPNDIGLFCVFFLNQVHLSPGEAMFLQANEPHAYLSGGICVS